ncbi:MAG TPA: DUF11 domain-containing protein [Methanothrix sp.]|nr:DUF11 domain-containing protein [Methanothrix sp.]
MAQIDGPVVGLVTLTNRVDVEGKPDHGGNVTANATAIVQAQEAKISVTKKADPALGSPGTWVNFTMNVTNTANSELVNVTASDDLPAGLIYQSSSPGGINSGQNVLWPEIGPMDVGQIKRLWILALVDNSAHGTLTNVVNVEGRPEQGDSVRDRATADVLVLNASINVTKSAFPPDGIPGTEMVFTIVINNTGEADLILTELRDTLPDGLAYLGDDHNGTFVDPNVVLWHDLGILPAGETITILVSTEVVGTIMGELDNLVDVIAVPVTGGQPVVSKSIAKVEAKPVPYVVTKKADKSTYKPGEEITYTITVCNTMQYIDMTDVVVKDVFEDPIEIIGTYPQASNDGTWYIDRIPGWQNGKSESCVEKIVVARAPKANTTFDLEQSVSGSGFVNVHNDVSTSIEPYDVKNCVYVSARVATETWNLSTCTSVTIQDLGTELDTREHGSGQYATEEKTRLIWQNKSIQSLKNVSAAYHPTTFLLPADRALNYASKWTEESRAKNYVTGAVMHETYRYADRVDRNTYVKMDENGSKMAIDASFVGKGSIGFYKKSNPDSGPKTRPIFESQQDYSGSFRINETFDEYGKNTRLMREVTGEGFASADQRIRSSQRSYEHGSGSYRSEELTDSVSNYMSKDIEVAHKPVSYNYSPTLQANQNLKWSEGMISKSGILRGGEIFAGNNSAGGELDRECIVSTAGTAPATVISEKFSSLEYMKKETVALGLNEMKTNATFQGVADFRAKSVGANGTGKVDDEERYVGSFDVSRHVLLTGVSRYDYPHITVSKVGIPRNELVNAINSTVINYTITVTNDGNRALAPVYVKDIFPAGTEYVSSSYRPSALSTTEANWTLLHIGIGDSQTISLKLNLTESAPANVLNCVEVAGITGGTLVSSFNCSLVQSDWMPCCPPKVAVEKKAEIDSVDATIVRYTVALKNNANSSMAVRVTDEIPGGMSLMQSSIQPYSTDSNRIVWAFGDFRPGEVKIIEYRMKAARNGAFTNRVHVTADALDGTGSSSADASAYIHVTGTGNAPYTTRYSGWQTPDWDMNTSEEGLTI